ncbi:MAG: hypothetical protein QXF46_03960 [Thermofilaceae archaeon]
MVDRVARYVLCILLLLCLAVGSGSALPERIVQEGFLVVGREGDYAVFNDILVVNSSVYIGGCTGKFGNNVWTLLKLDEGGSLSSYLSEEGGMIVSLAFDGSRIYAAGFLEHDTLPKTTGFLAAFTLNLERLWEREWVGSPVFSEFKGVYVRGDRVYVVGEAYYSGDRGFDVVVQKYDKEGSLLWENTLVASGHQEAESLVVSTGKIYVAGSTSPYISGGNVDGLVVVIDESSGLVETRVWGGEGNDFFKSIELDGAMYVCGFTDSYGKGGFDGVLLKLDLRGEVIWWRTFGNAGGDSFIDLALHEGEIHVVGHTTVNGSMLPVYLQYSFDGTLLGSWTLPAGNQSTWTSVYPAGGSIHLAGNLGKSPFLVNGIYARYATRYVLTVNFPGDGFWAALDNENKTGRSVSFETSSVERRLEVTARVNYGGTRLVFDGWSDGARDNPRPVKVVKDTVLNATYRVEHYVTVRSEYGKPSGEGWYAEGSIATVSVEPSIATESFFVNYVFEGWYENGRKVSATPTFSFVVMNPTVLKAGWRMELNLALIVLLLSVLLLALLLLFLLILERREKGRGRQASRRHGH